MLIDQLYRLETKDLIQSRETLVRAFAEDSLWQEVFSSYIDSQEKRRSFFEIPLRLSLTFGEAYADSPDIRAVAAWLPGERSSIGILSMIRSGAWRSITSLGKEVNSSLMPLLEVVDKDREKIMEGKRYTYLQVIGVDPDYQRQGLFSALMKALIEQSDQACRFLYLETSTDSNVPLYENLGFKIVGERPIEGLGITMREMERKPG